MKKILSLIFVTTLTQCAEQKLIPFTPEADKIKTINESEHPLISIVNRFQANCKAVNPIYYGNAEKKFSLKNKFTDEEKELICNHNASLNILLTKKDKTAIHHEPILSKIIYLSPFIDDIKFLLEQGADPNIPIYSYRSVDKSHKKESILYRLTSVGQACKESLTFELITLLLEKHTNPNLGSSNKDSSISPLYWPLMRNNEMIITILKKYNINEEEAVKNMIKALEEDRILQ